MNIHDQVHKIESREDLVAFIEALRKDLLTNQEAWENHTLDRFLEEMGAWVDDWHERAGVPLPPIVNWKAFGCILMGARIYE